MHRILPLALLALTLAACSGARDATDTATPVPQASGYEREVAPFALRGADGVAYEFPFLGGFNLPRPQWVDVDLDGDEDLFIQEASNRLIFFERVTESGEPKLIYRTHAFEDIDIGEWYRFADLDGDGDPDLMSEEPFSRIRVYRHDGLRPDGRPGFTALIDTLLDADGEPIFSDRQNIPNLTDLDCDGRVDLFIGRLDGTVSRYESVGPDDVGMPRFRLLDDRFEDIEIVTQVMGERPESRLPAWLRDDSPDGFGSATARHGANTLTFGDVDNDGDLDLFWGDFFEPGLLLIRNTGTSCANPRLRGEPEAFPPGDPIRTSGYNAPALTDWSGDGEFDVFIGVLGGAYNPNRTADANFYYLRREGDHFVEETRQFLTQLDLGGETAAEFGDFDGDGDLDMLIGNKIAPYDDTSGRLYYYENQGSAAAPDFRLADSLGMEAAYHYAPAAGDLDGDGDLDLLVGTWNDGISLVMNESASGGAPAFRETERRYVTLTRGSNAAPTLGDLDGDGDLDLIVGESSGTLNLYRNGGTFQAPAFTLVTDEMRAPDGAKLDPGRRSTPRLHDLDGDGDLDLVVGREQGGVVLYRNDGLDPDGTPQFTESPDLAPDLTRLALPLLTTPLLYDLDADGDADLVSGSSGGGLVFFRRN